MSSPPAPSPPQRSGLVAPLHEKTFRRIWTSSLLSNLGQQMQAVAAAWTMLEITGQADLVAMVQTAAMLPVMLIAIPAGAIADMYDRRRVAIAALVLCLCSAGLLAIVAATGQISPMLILLCIFLTGVGVSIYSPSWQASAAEIVGVKAMPAAVALYSLSANAARSVGPALGGFLIAAAGIGATFSVNAFLYVPIIVALLLWRRDAPPPRLPPERLDRAMLGGLRYVSLSQPTRRVLARALITGMGGAAIYSMLPLVARDILGAGPGSYGILLGAFGFGAVSFALATNKVRDQLSTEAVIATCSIILALAIVIAAFSPFIVLSAVAMIAAGGAWMVAISTCNVFIQLSSPRWVSGRTLAAFQAAVAAGLAGGALLWGYLAQGYGVVATLCVAGVLLGFNALLGRVFGMPDPIAAESAPPPSNDPIVQMALTGRSGPLVIEIEYKIRSDDARAFYHAMRDVRRSRERNGAFAVSLARDISDPELWIERFHYPTWNDYLRARDRPTVDDRVLRDRVVAFHASDEPPRVRRMLERPTGSVRWREDAIDPGETLPGPVTLTSFISN